MRRKKNGLRTENKTKNWTLTWSAFSLVGSTKIVRNSGSETVKQVPLMRCGCMNKTQPIYINAFCLYLNGFVASNMDLLAFICCFLHRTANKFNIFFIFVAFHIHIPCELFLLVCNSLLPHSSWFQTRFSNSREKKHSIRKC